MCRNPSCQNFGIHYEGATATGNETVNDDRYRFDGQRGRLRCRSCGQSFKLKANQGISPLARYYLELSLPFADCPKADCSNHGYNVFEHYTPGEPISTRRYRHDSMYTMRCEACTRRFRLGEALHATQSGGLKKSLRHIIDGVRTRRAVTDTIELISIATGTYYSRLFRISARLKDYQAWRNVRLLRKEFGNSNKPIRIFTDTLQVSLQRWGNAARYQNLDIVTSVVAVGNTYYILAAHPGFLPDKYCPDGAPPQPMDDPAEDIPSYLDGWDCVQHLYKKLSSRGKGQMEDLPDIGKGGYFSISPYTELAHFLVVRKMLSRFRKVHYIMDGSQTLYSAALTALAPDIRERKAEIVLFQHEKNSRDKDRFVSAESVPRGAWEERRKAMLDSAWHEMRERFKARPNKKGDLLLAESRLDAKTKAKMEAQLMKHAFKGGYSKSGGWAWLTYPPNNKLYKNNRILWLTWAPDKDYESLGRDLLWRATLQPVDSAFNFLRQRTYGLRRPVFRARPGRSYQDAYVDPRVICAELWIVLLWRNYGLRVKTPKKASITPPATAVGLTIPEESPPATAVDLTTPEESPPATAGELTTPEESPPATTVDLTTPKESPPATAVGLTTPKETPPDMVRYAWEFRLGCEHARRMTRWLRE